MRDSVPSAVVALDKFRQGHHKADDRLFRRFETPSDSVPRQGRWLAVAEECGRRDEGRGPHIHVEHLQCGGRDQITPPGQNSRRLRPANRLAAGIDHETCADCQRCAGRDCNSLISPATR